MKSLRSSYSRVLAWALVLAVPLLPGCVALPVSSKPPALNLSSPHCEFPPQEVMREGNYEAFLTANEKSLEECREYNACAAALFNLGFLHAYSKSPYINFTKALRHFERLNKEYPDSPWAFQAKAWLDILHRNIVLERNLRRMKSELKAKAGTVTDLHEEISHTQDRMQQSQDGLSEVEQKERKLLQTIAELQEQLKRSQEIDVEIEQKERELLQ